MRLLKPNDVLGVISGQACLVCALRQRDQIAVHKDGQWQPCAVGFHSALPTIYGRSSQRSCQGIRLYLVGFKFVAVKEVPNRSGLVETGVSAKKSLLWSPTSTRYGDKTWM
ncbi:hypothetical protein ElyMa_003157300 [Elysia marginata]|uniref:Uncharacterized protein n=1 Tax=Elysia marginata TaxID=1093978 RepID=A0AAV4IW64_9GAST|nr:hypothetical protein ElyMa_003157300 [Elysia marginata]